MNDRQKRLRTRFEPDTRFEVPAVPFRVAAPSELEKLKDRLLLQLLERAQQPEQNFPAAAGGQRRPGPCVGDAVSDPALPGVAGGEGGDSARAAPAAGADSPTEPALDASGRMKAGMTRAGATRWGVVFAGASSPAQTAPHRDFASRRRACSSLGSGRARRSA